MRFSIIASAFALLVSPAIADEAVTINFAADVGGKPFSCAETFPDIGSGKTTISGSSCMMPHSCAQMAASRRSASSRMGNGSMKMPLCLILRMAPQLAQALAIHRPIPACAGRSRTANMWVWPLP